MAVREAELRLIPKVSNKGKRELRKLSSEVKKTGRDMERAFGGADRSARRLERTYDAIGRSASFASRQSGRLTSSLMSVQSLALGVAGGLAGRTIFDSMIGSNIEMERQRVTFNTMLGDVAKADDLFGRINSYAAATPFAKGDLIEGSKRLLRLTGDNVDMNERLLKTASKMAAINPDKSISDAAEAILDAEQGEFERLKEFGLKLKKDDLKKIKKRGETMGQAALRGIEEGLTKQTGGRDVVGALSKTFAGRMSTLKDNISESMRVAGEPAFEVLKEGIQDISKDFEKLKTDPEFKKDLKDLAEFTSDMAKSSVQLARALPGAIRDARAFISENSTLLGVAGGAFVANKVSGGALGRGAFALGRRALFGKRGGGGGLGGAAGAMMGATPVYVVNMAGGLGDAAGSFLGRNAGKAGGAGFLKSIATKGALGTLGVGGLAAGAAIFGTATAAVATFAHVTDRTSKVVAKYEEREKKRLKSTNKPSGPTLTKADRFDPSATQKSIITSNVERLIGEYSGSSGEMFKSNVLEAFGGANSTFDSDFDKNQLGALNKALRSRGLRFDISDGQQLSEGRFVGGQELFGDELQRIQSVKKSISGHENYQVRRNLRESGELEKLNEAERRVTQLINTSEAKASGLNATSVDASIRMEPGAITVYLNGEDDVSTAKFSMEVRKQIEALMKEQEQRMALLSADG